MKSSQKEWKYYNHALIPTCAPHEEPDLSKIKNNSIWKIEKGKHPLLVRWTVNFDSTSPLEWWYIIITWKSILTLEKLIADFI